eukprot:334857-Chlamydomonas_euryale.AAC.7
MHYLPGQCRLCKNCSNVVKALTLTHWLPDFARNAAKKKHAFRFLGRFHGPFSNHMAWVVECRTRLHQVVAACLAASRREYISPRCNRIWNRADLANKGLKSAPEGCDSGPTHPHV